MTLTPEMLFRALAAHAAITAPRRPLGFIERYDEVLTVIRSWGLHEEDSSPLAAGEGVDLVSEPGAELAVGAPVESAVVGDMVGAAEGGGQDVVDLPALLALRSVVIPPNHVPVSIHAVKGGVELMERLAGQPRGELVAFKPGT